MQDYMTHLRNYVTELRKQGKVPAAADQRPAPNSTKLPTSGPKAS